MPTSTSSSSSSSSSREYFIKAAALHPKNGTKCDMLGIVTKCGEAPSPAIDSKSNILSQKPTNVIKDLQYSSVGVTVVGQCTRPWKDIPSLGCQVPPGGFHGQNDITPIIQLSTFTVSCNPATGVLSGWPTDTVFEMLPSQAPANQTAFCRGGVLGVAFKVVPAPDQKSIKVNMFARGGWDDSRIVSILLNGYKLEYDPGHVEDHPAQIDMSFEISSIALVPGKKGCP